jgi:hypothetical protein
MKTKIVLLALLGVSLQFITYGDVIFPDTHSVNYCPKIINLDKYPEISLIGYVLDGGGFNYCYLISDTICLEKGPNQLSGFILCAVSEIYMEYINNDIDKIDWEHDKNAYRSSVIQPNPRYYVNNTNPLSSLDSYYKIMGFTDSSLIVYKCKDVFGFSNGTPDSVIYYEFNGDSTMLFHQLRSNIILSNEHWQNYMDFGTSIIPNPADKKLGIKMVNSYLGKFDFSLFSDEGKLIYSITLNKTADQLYFEIPPEKLLKGIFFLRTTFRDINESKKIIIN